MFRRQANTVKFVSLNYKLLNTRSALQLLVNAPTMAGRRGTSAKADFFADTNAG